MFYFVIFNEILGYLLEPDKIKIFPKQLTINRSTTFLVIINLWDVAGNFFGGNFQYVRNTQYF